MQDQVTTAVRRWVSDFVVRYNLCPFAGRVAARGEIRFAVSTATTEDGLLAELIQELDLLQDDASVETTLLVHPYVLQDFYDFNDFIGVCEALLEDQDLLGVLQIASFHPQYQFAGTQPQDAENFSNRSPYPMLHILREDKVTQAVSEYADVAEIPARNLATLNELGADRLQAIYKGFVDD